MKKWPPRINRMRRAFDAWNRLSHREDRAWVASKALHHLEHDEREALLRRLWREHETHRNQEGRA